MKGDEDLVIQSYDVLCLVDSDHVLPFFIQRRGKFLDLGRRNEWSMGRKATPLSGWTVGPTRRLWRMSGLEGIEGAR